MAWLLAPGRAGLDPPVSWLASLSAPRAQAVQTRPSHCGYSRNQRRTTLAVKTQQMPQGNA